MPAVRARRRPAGHARRARPAAAHARRRPQRCARRSGRARRRTRSSSSGSGRSSTTSSAACAPAPCSVARHPTPGPNGSPVAWPAMAAAPDPKLMDRVVNLAKRRGPGLPVVRDLRRVPLHLGLRAARRPAQAQRQGRLVAVDGAAPRRHRRPRRRDPHGAEGVGGERPRRHLHRPARRLPQLQRALPRRPAARVGRVPELRRQGQLHRGAPVQPDVQDVRRPGGGRRRRSRTCGPRPRRASSSTSRTCRRPTRKKPPFGIAQIGKSFRNEITPGNFIFRTREFEQMEMEYFVPPDEGAKWYEYWVQRAVPAGTSSTASPKTMLRIRPHDPDELSHYSAGTTDIEFMFPWGWGELEGIAQPHRLRPHAAREVLGRGPHATSTRSDEPHYVPYVIEPAAGADRATLAFLLAAYARGRGDSGEKRTVLRLDPGSRRSRSRCCRCRRTRSWRRSPTTSPTTLRPHFMIDVDDAGAIGRRYRRQDEVGTPLCVTVDFDSLDDHAVTVRDRDTMEQERVPIDDAARRPARPPRPFLSSERWRWTTITTHCSASTPTRRPTTSAARTASKKAALDAKGDKSRGRRRALNKAWNVLSDPVPARPLRRAARASGDGRRGRRRRCRSTTATATRDRLAARRAAAPPPVLRAAAAREPRPAPSPTIDVARRAARSRSRSRASYALVIDVVRHDRCPLRRADRVQRPRSSNAGTRAEHDAISPSSRDDPAGQRQERARRRRRTRPTTSDEAADKAEDDKADNAERAARRRPTTTRRRTTSSNDEVADLSQKLAPAGIVVLEASCSSCFAYLVVPSALTGRRSASGCSSIRVVRVDGSPLGWSGALVRYGLIIARRRILLLLLPCSAPIGCR